MIFQKLIFLKILIDEILCLYPKLIEKIDKNKLSTTNWVHVIQNNSELINQCPIKNKFSIDEIVNLVYKEPKFVYMLPKIDKIKNKYLIGLIINRIEFIKELNINLKKFNVYDFIELLKKYPILIDKCDKIKEIDCSNWSKILQKQPELIKYCDKIDDFNGDDWYELLFYQPQFINKCNKYINTYLREVLIKNNFDLIDKIKIDDIQNYDFKIIVYNSKKYRNKVIKKYIEKYKDPEVLTNMIGIYPDLKELYTKKDLWKYVDFSKLTDNLEYSILK